MSEPHMFIDTSYTSCIIKCLTKLNCYQLQCIMLVNGPLVIHSDGCQWTNETLRENKIDLKFD